MERFSEEQITKKCTRQRVKVEEIDIPGARWLDGVKKTFSAGSVALRGAKVR